MIRRLRITVYNDIDKSSIRSWLWVLLYAAAIISIAPVARSIQIHIRDSLGRDFFVYLVISVVGSVSVILLYFFIFRLKIKKAEQYIWLFVSTALYVYFSLQLRANPEEAVHFIEYGVLSYFIFNALSHRIHDRTVYISTSLLVLLVGISDEFIQWLLPGRVWDYRDITFNLLAGGFLMIVIGKGIRPQIINKPVSKESVKVLAGIITIVLIVLGLCLSNTPDSVNHYTAVFKKASWLQQEEPMTEFGYKYEDPDIGTFYSRFTLEELRQIDFSRGNFYSSQLPEDMSSETLQKELLKKYNPNVNLFLYEFLRHVLRRNNVKEKLTGGNTPERTIQISNTAYRENFLIEKYFNRTLKNSGHSWSKKTTGELKKNASLWKGDYRSETGKIITFFSRETAWALIIIMLCIIWASAIFRINRLDAKDTSRTDG